MHSPDPGLVVDLERLLGPERVLSRPIDRLSRASDASLYRLIPQAVVRPRGLEEMKNLFALLRRRRSHLTFRAAGTSLSGQAVTSGVLAELAPFWRGCRAVDDGRRVWAQPGVVGGHLNRLLAPHRTRIGPDPASIDADRIVGCVVYPAAAVTEPGVIHHVEGDRFPLGELDGSESERAQKLHDLLVDAGFRSRILDDIRSEIWLKAWGNMTFNPISALTRATLAGICRFPETRSLAESMMAEAQVIAEKLGVTFRYTIEQRIAGAEAVGEHKTSMLQDLEAGRALETEALIGVVAELGRLTETPTPSIDAVYGCVKLLDETTSNVQRPKTNIQG